jgi:hypothetical protein
MLLLSCGGCTFYLGRAAADRTQTVASEEPAGKPAEHEQQCSSLRADISSSEHNQRASAPASNSPIIAAASVAKEDQRIEALRQRYAELGCVGKAATEPARGQTGGNR